MYHHRRERQREDRAYQQYVALLPWMKNPMPFDKYYKKREMKKRSEVSKRPAEEILKEAMEVEKRIEDAKLRKLQSKCESG